eukprot:8117320-Pyramimonas_sp.AAC.1
MASLRPARSDRAAVVGAQPGPAPSARVEGSRGSRSGSSSTACMLASRGLADHVRRLPRARRRPLVRPPGRPWQVEDFLGGA